MKIVSEMNGTTIVFGFYEQLGRVQSPESKKVKKDRNEIEEIDPKRPIIYAE